MQAVMCRGAHTLLETPATFSVTCFLQHVRRRTADTPRPETACWSASATASTPCGTLETRAQCAGAHVTEKKSVRPRANP